MDAKERARLRALRETIPAGDVAPCCERAGQDGHHSSWALGATPHGAAIRAWVAGPLDLLALARGFGLATDQALLFAFALPQVGEFAFVLLAFAGRLATTFDVDVVANTGDDADWGSDVESEILGGPVGLDVPYLWVRGNHDTAVTQTANAGEGAVVLDGTETTVDALVVFGVGDATFSPKLDKAVVKEGQTAFKQRWSTETMLPLLAAQPQRPDVVMTHDPAMTDAIEPKPPLRLAGHTHKLKVSGGTNPDGTPWVLVVNGSTGGAGLRVLDRKEENPMSAVIITVDRQTKQALYLDEFTYRPLVDQTFKVRRIDLRNLDPAN